MVRSTHVSIQEKRMEKKKRRNVPNLFISKIRRVYNSKGAHPFAWHPWDHRRHTCICFIAPCAGKAALGVIEVRRTKAVTSSRPTTCQGWLGCGFTDRQDGVFFVEMGGGNDQIQGRDVGLPFFPNERNDSIFFSDQKHPIWRERGTQLGPAFFHARSRVHPSELPVMAPVMAPVAILEQRWRLLSEAWQIWESEPLLACFLI